MAPDFETRMLDGLQKLREGQEAIRMEFAGFRADAAFREKRLGAVEHTVYDEKVGLTYRMASIESDHKRNHGGNGNGGNGGSKSTFTQSSTDDGAGHTTSQGTMTTGRADSAWRKYALGVAQYVTTSAIVAVVGFLLYLLVKSGYIK